MNKRNINVFLALLGGAFLVRVLYLGRADLWCDEILFVNLSMPPLGPVEIFQTAYEKFLVVTHLPFAEIVQNILLRILAPLDPDISHNPFLQRFPAVLWGAFTVPMYHLLARRVLRPAAAWVATGMMMLFLYPVFFSREAYFYSPLMFLATAYLVVYVDALSGRRVGWPMWVLFGLSALGMAFVHITGALMLCLTLVGLVVAWVLNRPDEDGQRPAAPRTLYLAVGLTALALLAVSPFFLKLVTHESPLNYPEGISWFSILYDIVGKWFMGNLPTLHLLGWVVFLAGMPFLLRRGEQHMVRRILFGLLVVGLLILTTSTFRTQYWARYFACLSPVAYLVFTAGLDELAGLPGRWLPSWQARRGRVFLVLAGLVLGTHALFFLPQYYQLPAKGVNYGGIARWVNDNVPPGKPYLLESGYELRFVSQFHATPQRIAACPYIHGPDPEEVQRLRASHEAFIRQFPESPWIESARHGMKEGMDLGDWEWPHQHFRQRHDIENNPLRRMSNWGIWMQSIGAKVDLNSISTPVWHNTLDDLEAIARERGDRVLLDFSSWGTMQFDRGRYARYTRPPSGDITLTTLTGDQPARGKLVLTGTIAGTGESLHHQLMTGTNILQRFRQPAGRLGRMETPVLEFAPGEHTLTWRLEPGQELLAQGLLLNTLQFVPSDATPKHTIEQGQATPDVPIIKWVPTRRTQTP